MINQFVVTQVFKDTEYDVISIIKGKLCCIKGCKSFATEHLCSLGMCKTHHNQARD
jgi:hypothetical protein